MSTTFNNDSTFPLQNVESSSLCFSKDNFYAPNFDIDTFLTRYKREFGLERLNNDLAIYLRVLKSSMSELINREYADFVNLSTNLVGLDKAINDLKKPLLSIKNEVETVQNAIDKENKVILNKINEKLSIEKRRIVLKLLMNWQRSLKVTNEMIVNDMNRQKLTGDHVERMAFEFRQLKHSLTICQNEITQNDEINRLSLVLEKIMNDLFIKSFHTNDREQLIHILKSYILLNKQHLAEHLFLDLHTKPYMTQYLNEAYLETNEEKLDGVYTKVIEFVQKNLEFLRLTNEIKCGSLNSNDPSKKHQKSEFNFLLNSIFTHVVETIDLNLSQIFSPSDPNQFLLRYKITINFLNKFEQLCTQDLQMPSFEIIKQSKSYKYFLKKFPINIYFQIRFQEIVTKFEQVLISANTADQYNQSEDERHGFHLKPSQTLYELLCYCWSNDCYLSCLLSYFWKLNLQLISRYESFYRQTLNDLFPQSLPNEANSQPQPQELVNLNVDLKFFNFLIVDIKKLCEKLPNFFDAYVAAQMRSCGVKEIGGLKESLTMSIQKLQELNQQINEKIVAVIVQQACQQLKSTNEIPRLYRRTNREAPKQASNYVKVSVQCFIDFHTEWGQYLAQDELDVLYLRKMIDQTCQKYYSISNDLLTSVKKMEDSLKRLKRVRGDAKQAAASTTATTTPVVTPSPTDSLTAPPSLNTQSSQVTQLSDDDKIRLQLYLDVCEFGSSLQDKFSYQGDEHYQVLFKLVDEVKSQIEV